MRINSAHISSSSIVMHSMSIEAIFLVLFGTLEWLVASVHPPSINKFTAVQSEPSNWSISRIWLKWRIKIKNEYSNATWMRWIVLTHRRRDHWPRYPSNNKDNASETCQRWREWNSLHQNIECGSMFSHESAPRFSSSWAFGKLKKLVNPKLDFKDNGNLPDTTMKFLLLAWWVFRHPFEH